MSAFYAGGNWNHAKFARAITWAALTAIALVAAWLVGLAALAIYAAVFGFVLAAGYWAGHEDGWAAAKFEAINQNDDEEPAP